MKTDKPVNLNPKPYLPERQLCNEIEREHWAAHHKAMVDGPGPENGGYKRATSSFEILVGLMGFLCISYVSVLILMVIFGEK